MDSLQLEKITNIMNPKKYFCDIAKDPLISRVFLDLLAINGRAKGIRNKIWN